MNDALAGNVRNSLDARGRFAEVVTRGHEDEPILIELHFKLPIGGRQKLLTPAIAKFRNPDSLQSPSAELLKLTNRRYHKIAGSGAIAPHSNIDSTQSKRFYHLVQAIRKASL